MPGRLLSENGCMLSHSGSIKVFNQTVEQSTVTLYRSSDRICVALHDKAQAAVTKKAEKAGAEEAVEVADLPAGDEEAESTTIYVKNLAWATTDATLRVGFLSLQHPSMPAHFHSEWDISYAPVQSAKLQVPQDQSICFLASALRVTCHISYTIFDFKDGMPVWVVGNKGRIFLRSKTSTSLFWHGVGGWSRGPAKLLARNFDHPGGHNWPNLTKSGVKGGGRFTNERKLISNDGQVMPKEAKTGNRWVGGWVGPGVWPTLGCTSPI